MECKNCNTINADDAVYCKVCGNRLDGKKNCTACGSVIDGDSIYCNACGARVDGKNVCRNCGAVYDGMYCPQCGFETERNNASASRSVAKVKANKILNYISLGLVIALAALSIIFVCLTGINLNVSQEILQGNNMSIGIFDYFGKEIQDIKELLNASNEGYTTAYKTALYLPAVLGLISVIVSLVGTVSFAITGAVKSILNLVKKNGKSATGWALLAFAFYMFGVSMIMSINAVSGTASSYSTVAEVSFNDATIAGIVLCTITLAGVLSCDFTVYFMNGKNTKFKLAERVLAVAVAVFAVITVAMFASPVAKLVTSVTSNGVLSKGTIGMGLLQLFSAYVTIGEFDSVLTPENVEALNLTEVYIILGQLLIFIAVVSALLLFVTVLGKDGKKGRCLSIVSSSIFLLATLIALIATVLAGNQFLPVMTASTEDVGYNISYKMTYGAAITALVFAVIAFAGNICRVVFSVKNNVAESVVVNECCVARDI